MESGWRENSLWHRPRALRLRGERGREEERRELVSDEKRKNIAPRSGADGPRARGGEERLRMKRKEVKWVDKCHSREEKVTELN